MEILLLTGWIFLIFFILGASQGVLRRSRGPTGNSQAPGQWVQLKGLRMWCCINPGVPKISWSVSNADATHRGTGWELQGCTCQCSGDHMVSEIKSGPDKCEAPSLLYYPPKSIKCKFLILTEGKNVTYRAQEIVQLLTRHMLYNS